jgi:DNA-binding SARP family transcriptional activator
MAAMPTASRARATAVAHEQQPEPAIFDFPREAPVESPPPERRTVRRGGSSAAPRRAPIAVGPRIPAVVVPAVPRGGGLLGAMPEFPIQVNKVQPPPLREQTLARDRLLDWLAAKIHDRVVLVIAEAGYGKTTLLADFARRTRLRTLWYRLDRGDRDWVGFIAHLAAAVRVHMPDFGQSTVALLREAASSPPSLEIVLDTLIRELGELPSDPTVLIFDDFHLVDDNADARYIVRDLIGRAPDRVSFVFASRRTPPVPLARLRALGEVAEIGTDDLRFDEAETEQLFRDTYEIPLERVLIAELSKRTEGWAASLQLVRAALHDRDPVQARAFIGSLSGAEGHLYDYLAEEVIGDLPTPLQEFLMRTSILETIDVDLGSVAAGIPPDRVRAHIAEAETLGLVSKRGGHARQQARAHPLVREFLRARLTRSIEPAALRVLHHSVARAADGSDWLLAARHYHAAGDNAAARRVIAGSINSILATGAYVVADALIRSTSEDGLGTTPGLVLASKVALSNANPGLSLELAEQALREDPSSVAAALTVIGARSWTGDLTGAISEGLRLESSAEPLTSHLARAFRKVIETSIDGSFSAALQDLDLLLETLTESGDDHYVGVTHLNRSNLLFAMDRAPEMLVSAETAVEHLLRSSRGIELVSARVMRATALAFLGRQEEWRTEIGRTLAAASGGQRGEALFESAAIEMWVGSEESASHLLAEASDLVDTATDNGQQALLVRAFLSLRRGAVEQARSDLTQVAPRRLRTAPAFEARRLLAAALVESVDGHADRARRLATEARQLSADQDALLWSRVAQLVTASLTSPEETNLAIRAAASNPTALSLACEPIVTRLGSLDADATRVVAGEARRRPDRWLPTIRRAVDLMEPMSIAAARLLDEIGQSEDVARLRTFARKVRLDDALGRTLARRLAPRVLVQDLGRVRIQVGDLVLDGGEIRRKVLALLCLLVSKERFAATREEVLDCLWPDLDPTSALNSLNQTVYFLRRVFEPAFREDTSPGYVRQDGETIWLDIDLVDATSRRCRELIGVASRGSTDEAAMELSNLYSARFALDFQYDDWASTYRDSLHASYLRVIEQQLRTETAVGHYARAIQVAERAVQVEPDSEDLQVALVRLYRLAGAHAAAAEQYGHYARSMKGLGVEVPTFDVVLSGDGSIGTPAY